jgi:hypothetical protein
MFLPKKAIAILTVLFLVFPGVMAQSISFAEPSTTTHKDVYLYYANGTLIGLYNTTSTGIAIPNETFGDLLFVIKPQYSSPLDEPGDFLTSIIGFIQTNVLSLLILAAMGGLFFKRF